MKRTMSTKLLLAGSAAALALGAAACEVEPGDDTLDGGFEDGGFEDDGMDDGGMDDDL
jgi:hypothetical protein